MAPTTGTIMPVSSATKLGLSNKSLVIKKNKNQRTIRCLPQSLEVFRELVDDSDFSLSTDKWSPWQMVITTDKRVSNYENWYRYLTFYMKMNILVTNPHKPSVFEFAVQTGPRAELHVVYSQIANTITPVHWERQLFGRKDIKRQVYKVAKRGFNIYIRQLELTSEKHTEKVQDALLQYDYCWKKIRYCRTAHRKVEISSDVISD